MDDKHQEKQGIFDKNGLFREVQTDEADLRLDRWFKRHFPVLTHGQLQKWLRKGQIRVDGGRIDSSFRLVSGQQIRLPPALLRDSRFSKMAPRSGNPVRDLEKLKKTVLYEDDDVVVLNKPAGLAVQGGTGLKENLDDSLMIFSLDGTTRPKLVHRLDKDTCGVLLIARNDFSAAKLAKAFRLHTTQKIYWAVTCGVPEADKGMVDAPLVKKGQLMCIAEKREEGSKKAATFYQVVEKAGKKAAFVALWPLTGRTHQLRVHMEHIAAPLLGDPFYGRDVADDLPRQDLGKGLHLHARRLIIPHPRGGVIDVTAPLGAEMLRTWKWFGFSETVDVSFDDI